MPQLTAEYLASETDIIWLEDIAPLRFVRVYVWRDMPPRRRIPANYFGNSNSRIVGYALCDEPRDSRRSRRVFISRDSDATYPIGCPVEGYDPRTIFPGIVGEETPRARGHVCV